MYYDLHIHTCASDGTLSPAQVVEQAAEMGLPGIAITDHDTIDGIDPAFSHRFMRNLAIDIIPGIEMNTESGDEEIHVLGYFIDHKYPPLLEHLSHIKDARLLRATKMVQRLRDMGFGISLEQVQRLAGSDLIARPHVAMALMEKSYVFSVKEAFGKYIGKGRPAYVSRYKFTPDEALNLIRNAGGISVLAHPGLIKNQSVIYEMIEKGVEGLEVYYPEHTRDETDFYKTLAQQHGLQITGGSDFHGIGRENDINRMGYCGITADVMDKIYKYRIEKTKKNI